MGLFITTSYRESSWNKGSVEQRRSVREFAPIATSAPDSEKATDLMTFTKKRGSLKLKLVNIRMLTYLFVFDVNEQFDRWKHNAFIVLREVNLSPCGRHRQALR